MIWLNGRLVPRDKAQIDPADRGLLLADGLFETLRAYRGRIFRLDDHLARMTRGAAELGIALPVTAFDVAEAAHEVLRANELARSDAALRITLTRGPGQRGLLPPDDPRPTLIISTVAYQAPAGSDGFSVITSERARRNEGSITARLKSLGYLDNVVAQVEARAAGADEAILLNNQGAVACGARSNIFAVIKGKVITPPIEEGALPGITRAIVLHLCRELSVQTAEARLGHGDLAKAEEVFLTNSLLEIVPVRRADGRQIPTGAVTRRLAAAYSQLLPC